MNQTQTNLLTEDELIFLVHLRMNRYTVRSALQYMQRPDVTPEQFNSFVQKSRFKNTNGLFTTLGDIVHERRQQGLLPDVPAPKKPPARRQYFDFRRK